MSLFLVYILAQVIITTVTCLFFFFFFFLQSEFPLSPFVDCDMSVTVWTLKKNKICLKSDGYCK